MRDDRWALDMSEEQWEQIFGKKKGKKDASVDKRTDRQDSKRDTDNSICNRDGRDR